MNYSLERQRILVEFAERVIVQREVCAGVKVFKRKPNAVVPWANGVRNATDNLRLAHACRGAHAEGLLNRHHVNEVKAKNGGLVCRVKRRQLQINPGETKNRVLVKCEERLGKVKHFTSGVVQQIEL
jgi:hypothetical protein